MYCFEPHDYRELVGRNLVADGKELAVPFLVGTLPNLEKGMQD